MSDEELEDRGHFARGENGKKIRRSPQGVRVDIYTKDVSGIEVSLIIDHQDGRDKIIRKRRNH